MMNIFLRQLIFFAAFLILLSCDELGDDFFEKLLQDKEFSGTRICAQTPSVLSDGDFFEVYNLSADVLDRFKKKLNNNSMVEFPDKDMMSPYGGYDIYTPWKKCAIKNQRLMESLNYLETSQLSMKCFSIEELIQISQKKDSYYTLFYDLEANSIVSYQLFIIELETGKLFHVQIHML